MGRLEKNQHANNMNQHANNMTWNRIKKKALGTLDPEIQHVQKNTKGHELNMKKKRECKTILFSN